MLPSIYQASFVSYAVTLTSDQVLGVCPHIVPSHDRCNGVVDHGATWLAVCSVGYGMTGHMAYCLIGLYA